ncbi:hypothetical protein [Kocuria sp. U4B]
MNVTAADNPEAVPPAKTPRWVLALAALAVVTVLAGALTVLLNPAEATFGWFAYTPMNGETFPGMTFLTPQAVMGWVGFAVGAILLAFCVGWLVGRRSTARR